MLLADGQDANFSSIRLEFLIFIRSLLVNCCSCFGRVESGRSLGDGGGEAVFLPERTDETWNCDRNVV